MDGVKEPDENGKISNLLDPDVEIQTKLQNWPNPRDENGILLFKLNQILCNRLKLQKDFRLQPFPNALVSETTSPVARLMRETKLAPMATIASINSFGTRVL
ncbi:hypothetical protein Hanom_Chr12g01128771 [Helianthus anomalus]